MVGKWHLCPTVEMNLASTRRNWPTGRGFERFYGFLGAETSQWFPELIYDNHPVDQPKTPEEGYHFGEDITDKAIEFIMDAKAVAPDKPFFLYYAPGAAHAPHHAPKDWIDRYRASSTWATRRCARRRWPARRRWASSRPSTELPPRQPDRHAADAHRARREAVPGDGHHPALGHAVRRGEAPVRPDGRGLRRLPVPRRPPGRSTARLPRDDRPAREHDDHRRVGQRCQWRGWAGRLGQRDAVHERHPGRHQRQPQDARRAGWTRRPTTTTPTAGRWRSTRRSRCGSATSSTAGRATRASSRGRPGSGLEGRDPRPVPPRDRPRPDRARRAGHRPAREDQGPHPEPLRRREHALQLRRRRALRARGTPSSSRCSARAASGTTAGRPSRPTRRSPAGATSARTPGSSTTPTSTAPSCTTSPPSSRRSSARWSTSGTPRRAPTRASRSTTAPRWRSSSRRGRSCRRRAARYVYFPEHAEVPEAQAVDRPWPLVRHRRARRHPGAGRPGRAVLAGFPLRRSRPVRQGRPAALRQQLRRHVRAEGRRDRGPPDRDGPDPVGLVREGRRGPAARRDRHPVAVPRRRRRSARAGSRPSPAAT